MHRHCRLAQICTGLHRLAQTRAGVHRSCTDLHRLAQACTYVYRQLQAKKAGKSQARAGVRRPLQAKAVLHRKKHACAKKKQFLHRKKHAKVRLVYIVQYQKLQANRRRAQAKAGHNFAWVIILTDWRS